MEATEIKPFHLLMHLAASLTETVRVSDVAETIANQFLPAFDATGLVLMTASEGRLRVVGHRGYDTAFLSLFDGHSLASDNPPAKALTGHGPCSSPVSTSSSRRTRRLSNTAPGTRGRFCR